MHEEVELAGLLWRLLGCVRMNFVSILKVSFNVNNSAICNKTHLEDIHYHLTSMTISRLKRGGVRFAKGRQQ